MLYRNILVAVAALSLGTAVFAEDVTTTKTTETTTAVQPADTAVETISGDNAQATTSTTTTTTVTDKLDVNTATAKQLMKIKGINSVRAHAIVRYRKKHGNFKSLDDLRDVNGFKKLSDEKLQMIEDQLTVS